MEFLAHHFESLVVCLGPRRMLLGRTLALFENVWTSTRRRDVDEQEPTSSIGIDLFKQGSVLGHELRDEYLSFVILICPANTRFIESAQSARGMFQLTYSLTPIQKPKTESPAPHGALAGFAL